MAVAVLDAVDQSRLDLPAAVVEHGVSADHAKQGGLARAKREREVWRQTVVDTEAPRVFADQRHADILGEAHCHEVTRLIYAEPQRRWPIVFLGVVFRRPDAGAGVDLEWRMGDHARGLVAIGEGGGRRDRLD